IRGFTWRKMREFEKSLADYDAALALRPQQADTLFGRGVTLYDMGVREEAQADFAAARSLQPDIADHYARIGIRRAFDSYGSITRTGEPSSQALTASTVSP
ncbi:MAG: tetratricopeptide repeat protein, partial [Reyranellaceae bacterium]